MFTRMKEVKEQENLDILFLGSSHAYRGFDTRIYKRHGFKTFNLGSSAQTPLQTEVLLHRYLNTLNPKLIIYELDPERFSSDGVESSGDIIANDRNDVLSLSMAFRQNHIVVYNTLIYGYYRDVLHKNKGFVEKRKKTRDTYFKGGFVERALAYYNPVTIGELEWKNRAEQVHAFERNLSQIKARNIPFIIVRTPVVRSKYRAHVDNIEFNNNMKVYGSYYDFNELMELDEKLHFYDSDHLNQIGVELFNEKLIECLFDSKT